MRKTWIFLNGDQGWVTVFASSPSLFLQWLACSLPLPTVDRYPGGVLIFIPVFTLGKLLLQFKT
jgi:hypothetical protein